MPFTSRPWSTPESNLSASDFCKVCLIDLNPSGQEKIKGKCYLPVRSRPSAPYNRNAIRAAMGGHGLMRIKGVPAAAKRKAARRLVRLAREAGIEVGVTIKRLGGGR